MLRFIYNFLWNIPFFKKNATITFFAIIESNTLNVEKLNELFCKLILCLLLEFTAIDFIFSKFYSSTNVDNPHYFQTDWCRCGYCDVNEKFNHVCCFDLHKTIETNNEHKKKIWPFDNCVIKWPKVFKTALSQKYLEKEDNWRRYKVDMDPTDNP